MSIETNLNQSPYFDDFDEDKNFHRVLFRPGFAVQARELTQLQSILQNQLGRLADEVYIDGIIVTGGGLTTQEIAYVKLRDKDANNRVIAISDFFSDSGNTKIANAVITGVTSGVTGKLVFATTGSEAAAPDNFTLHVHYTNSGTNSTTKEFADGETLILRQSSDNAFIVAANAISSSATGFGLKANIQDGIVIEGGNQAESISLSVVIAGLGYEYCLTNHLIWYAYTGYTINMNNRLRDENREEVYKLDNVNAFYLRTGIKFKI